MLGAIAQNLRRLAKVVRHRVATPNGRSRVMSCSRSSGHQTTNLGVVSSNLSGRANIINNLRQFRSQRRLAWSHWGAQLGAHEVRLAPATTTR